MSDPKFSPEPAPIPPAANFHCELQHDGHHAAWVTLDGELDLATVPELASRLEEALGSTRLLVVDLRQLTFMDSSGLSVLLEAHQTARRSGSRLVLVRGPAQVTRLFDITGLSERFEFADVPVLQVGPTDQDGDMPSIE